MTSFTPGQLRVELRPPPRCPVMPGISMSRRATSTSWARAAASDLVAAGHLGDDLDVVLQAEQRGQRLADHRLVLGEQDLDRAVVMQRILRSAAAPARHPRRPGGSRAGVARRPPGVPPASTRRSVRPVRPLPRPCAAGAGPRPSSSTVSSSRRPVQGLRRAGRPRSARAPLCRTTLVTASRSAQARRPRLLGRPGAVAARRAASRGDRRRPPARPGRRRVRAARVGRR